MLFNSWNFLIFFPVVVGIYFLIPQRFKKIWLLCASYYFYMNWNAAYAILILGVTIISYIAGILIEKRAGEERRGQKLPLIICVMISLGVLFVFKYLNFVLANVNHILSMTGSQMRLPLAMGLVLPVGISFYTFQALGYVVDVYRGEVAAERNFIQYALFVSFFPQLVAGPIERSKNLLKQLDTPKEFDYDSAKNGLLLMLWGYFEKMWIADRASVLVDSVYLNYQEYSAGMLVAATALFAIQIYCDFGGYSHIAIGAAQVLGIRLMDNFRQPYLARNIKDFWSRWHISLSTWFRDYVYIPLGGNRRGALRTYINLFLTFLLSGLWHGASWHYVVWGGMNGFYQVVSRMTAGGRARIREVLHIREENGLYRLFQTIVTFVLADFAWLFFRAYGLSDAFRMIRHILVNRTFLPEFANGTLFTLGLRPFAVYQLILSLVILLVVDLLHEKKISLRRWCARQHIVIRWSIYLVVMVAFVVLLIQNYGRPAAEFIYFQF